MSEQSDNNLINFIATTVETLRDRMATKVDLADLRDQVATKDGLKVLETSIHGDFEQVHLRFDTLERVMSTRLSLIETEVSRLRSVLIFW